MIGTIRKHQTWLWAIIITVTVISFVIYFGPQSRVSGTSRGPAYYGRINGQPISEEQMANARREIELRYFFMSDGSWFNELEAKRRGFDFEQQTYQWLLLIQKEEQLGVHVSVEVARR